MFLAMIVGFINTGIFIFIYSFI